MGSHSVHMSSTCWIEPCVKTYTFVKTRLLGQAGSSIFLGINIRSSAVLQKMLLRHFRYTIYGVDNMQDIL
jgi:hypothetical protein